MHQASQDKQNEAVKEYRLRMMSYIYLASAEINEAVKHIDGILSKSLDVPEEDSREYKQIVENIRIGLKDLDEAINKQEFLEVDSIMAYLMDNIERLKKISMPHEEDKQDIRNLERQIAAIRDISNEYIFTDAKKVKIQDEYIRAQIQKAMESSKRLTTGETVLLVGAGLIFLAGGTLLPFFASTHAAYSQGINMGLSPDGIPDLSFNVADTLQPMLPDSTEVLNTSSVGLPTDSTDLAPIDPMQTKESLHKQAETYYKDAEYSRARECIEEAIRLDPEDPRLYLTKIYISGAIGENFEGKDAVKKALVLARKNGLGREFIAKIRDTLAYLGEFKLLDEEWDFVNERWFRPWIEQYETIMAKPDLSQVYFYYQDGLDAYRYFKKVAGERDLKDIHIKELAALLKEDLGKPAKDIWEWNGKLREVMVAEWLSALIYRNVEYKHGEEGYFRLSRLFEVKDEMRGRNCLSGSLLFMSLGREFGLDTGCISIILDASGKPAKHTANYYKFKQPITGEWDIIILDVALDSNNIKHQKIMTRIKGSSEAVIIDYEEFIKKAEDIMGLDANSIYADILVWEVYDYNNKAKEEFDINKQSRLSNLALEIYKQAIRLNEKQFLAYLYTANIYYRLEQYGLALSYGEKAITSNPYYPPSYQRRGWSYYKLGNYNKATEDFKKTLSLKSDNKDESDAYDGLGWCAYERENYDEAIENFNKAITLNSEHADAYNGLGWCAYERENYDEAISQFEETVRLEPKFENAYVGLGLTYFQKGEYEKTIENLEKALELNPNQPHVRQNLEEAKVKLQELQEQQDLKEKGHSENIIEDKEKGSFSIPARLSFDGLFASTSQNEVEAMLEWNQLILSPDSSGAVTIKGHVEKTESDYIFVAEEPFTYKGATYETDARLRAEWRGVEYVVTEIIPQNIPTIEEQERILENFDDDLYDLDWEALVSDYGSEKVFQTLRLAVDKKIIKEDAVDHICADLEDFRKGDKEVDSFLAALASKGYIEAYYSLYFRLKENFIKAPGLTVTKKAISRLVEETPRRKAFYVLRVIFSEPDSLGLVDVKTLRKFLLKMSVKSVDPKTFFNLMTGKEIGEDKKKELKEIAFLLGSHHFESSRRPYIIPDILKDRRMGEYDGAGNVMSWDAPTPNMLEIYIYPEKNTLPQSQYRPTSITDQPVVYYSIKDWSARYAIESTIAWPSDFLKKLLKMKKGEILYFNETKYFTSGESLQFKTGISLLSFLQSFGRDDKGIYMSIYDIWDFKIDGGSLKEIGLELFEVRLMEQIGKAIPIYDRYYFSEEEIEKELERRGETVHSIIKDRLQDKARTDL